MLLLMKTETSVFVVVVVVVVGVFFCFFALGVISLFITGCTSGFTLGLGVQTRSSYLCSGTFPCRTIVPVPCDSYYKVSSTYTFRSSLGPVLKIGTD